MIKLISLDNGLRLIFDRRSQRRATSISVWLKSGKRDERGDSGISHFLEHALFLGSSRFPSPFELARPVERVGGGIGAASGSESTIYYSNVPHQYCDLALEIMLDMLLNPILNQERLENEKKVINSEIEMYEEDNYRYLNDILVPKQLWGEHPLGDSGLGSVESVNGMDREKIREYHSNYYTPGNTIYSIAGRFDEDRILDTISSAFAGRNGQVSPKRIPFIDSQMQPDIRFFHRDIQQSFLTMSFKAPSYMSGCTSELELINLYLSGGMSSILFEEVRNKRGLAYDIHSDLQLFRDCGAMYISAEIDPGKAGETLDVVNGLLFEKAEKGFSEEEIEELKSMYLGGLQMRLEDLSFKSSWVASHLLKKDEMMDLAKEKKKVKRLAPTDLDKVLKTILTPNRWNMAILGPNEKFKVTYPRIAE